MTAIGMPGFPATKPTPNRAARLREVTSALRFNRVALTHEGGSPALREYLLALDATLGNEWRSLAREFAPA